MPPTQFIFYVFSANNVTHTSPIWVIFRPSSRPFVMTAGLPITFYEQLMSCRGAFA